MTDITKVNTIGSVDASKVRTIETITGEIKALQQHTLNCLIEIGRRLCEAKDMLPHGEFGNWLEREVMFSTSTANNYMRLFQDYGAPQSSLFGAEMKSQALANLSYTKALRLLALPENEREEFAEENDVKNMSTRELDRLIKERDAAINQRDVAIKAAADAEKTAAEENEGAARAIADAQERADKLAEELKLKANTVRELSEQLEELKAQPIDVTVAPEPDPEKLEAEINKAKAEVEAARKKEIAELEKKLKAAEKEKTSAEKSKDAADGEKQKLLEELAAEKAKTAHAEHQLETIRKTQAMSDPVVTEFGVIYNDVQEKLKKLTALMDKAGDRRPNLAAALTALLDTYRVSTEAGA